MKLPCISCFVPWIIPQTIEAIDYCISSYPIYDQSKPDMYIESTSRNVQFCAQKTYVQNQ